MIISMASQEDKDTILKKYPMACNFRQYVTNDYIRYITFKLSLQSSKLNFYYPRTNIFTFGGYNEK